MDHKPKSNDPLHGITLETIVKHLVDHFGWAELGEIGAWRVVPLRLRRELGRWRRSRDGTH